MTSERNLSRERYEAELIAEAQAEAVRDEIAERDADDDRVMPRRPVPKPVRPTPPPAAAAKHLLRPVPRPPVIEDAYGPGDHLVRRRGPYDTRKKREEAERQPRADRPPPERLTVKVAPMAIPGRPTGFVMPDMSDRPRRPEPVLPRPEAGKDGETRIDHAALVAYRKEAGVWTVAQDLIVSPCGVVKSTARTRTRLTDREVAARLESMPPAPPPALADIPVVYPPPPPGYEVGFYIDPVTGERKADGWPGARTLR